MRAHNILSVAVLALTSIITSVRAEVEWFAVFHNESGYTFLDTQSGNLKLTTEISLQNVEANTNTGERWAFSDNKLYNQAIGEGKYVGFDDNSKAFAAKYGDSDTSNLVTVKRNDTHASFCRGTACIGASGTSAAEYFWYINTVLVD